MPRIRKRLKGKAEVTEPIDPAAQAQLDLAAYQKEELEKKIRQEALRSRMKERIELEEKLGYLNRLKIQDNWRRIMRLNALEDLKNQIEVLSQTHEREVISAIHQKLTTSRLTEKTLKSPCCLMIWMKQKNNFKWHCELICKWSMNSRIYKERALMPLQLNMSRVLQKYKQSLLQKGLERNICRISCPLRKQIIAQHAREKAELAEVMAQMERQFNETEAGERTEWQTQREQMSSMFR